MWQLSTCNNTQHVPWVGASAKSEWKASRAFNQDLLCSWHSLQGSSLSFKADCPAAAVAAVCRSFVAGQLAMVLPALSTLGYKPRPELRRTIIAQVRMCM
jgi:hypothetical protein